LAVPASSERPQPFFCGLFAEETWLKIIRDAGFLPKMLPFEHSELEEGKHVLFVGIRNRA